MKSKVELITPEYAMKVLENHNPRNRNLSEQTVQSYAADMRNGRWVLNHQGIAFDTEGNLVDGQHRLWAVVFSSKETEFLVTRDIPVIEKKNGLDICPMDTVDRGRVRQTGQSFQLSHNIKNGNQVAAACRAIALTCYPNRAASRISTANSLMIYEIYKDDITTVIGCLNSRKKVGPVVGPISMFHRGEPEKARVFCQQISTYENVSPPAAAFIKYSEQATGKRQPDKDIRIICQCLMNFHEGSSAGRAMDTTAGKDFITGMFPSITKKIREALRPVEIGRAGKRDLLKLVKSKEKE